MPKSETLGKLAEALAKAQGEIQHAHKDKDNPFFKSSYADLASVWDACREPLSKNGLCVVQTLESKDGPLFLNTVLMHASGEWVSSQVPIIPVKNDPQGLGSAITYMRRFSLAALVGVAPSDSSDDDGEAAMGRKPVQSPATKPLPAPAAKMGPFKPTPKPVASTEMPDHMKDTPPWQGY